MFLFQFYEIFLSSRIEIQLEGKNLIKKFIYKPLETMKTFMSQVMSELRKVFYIFPYDTTEEKHYDILIH